MPLKANIKIQSLFSIMKMFHLRRFIVAGYPLGKKKLMKYYFGAEDNYSNFQTNATINLKQSDH